VFKLNQEFTHNRHPEEKNQEEALTILCKYKACSQHFINKEEGYSKGNLIKAI